jgi:hypothetical protein
MVGPVSEWVIYRHLWRIPFSGLGALLRKLVSNELLLGYLGEVQFYAWARARLNMVAAPFGAIKDVTILSALTGNIVTLVMLAGAWRLISSGAFGMEGARRSCRWAWCSSPPSSSCCSARSCSPCPGASW